MKSATLLRVLLVPVCCAAWYAGVTIASERSASSMANAANKFLASLTPEQRQQATFAFESEELTRWHYVPAQQFPRNGLAIRAMNETQRGLAHGALPASAFHVGNAATDEDQRIIYDQTTGNLYYDADGSGGGAAILFATLHGAPAITASDFQVI